MKDINLISLTQAAKPDRLLKTYDFKDIKIDEISEINDLSIKQLSS